MSWTCPHCDKTFAKAHQSHQCVKVDPLSLFDNNAPHLLPLFQQLLKSTEEFCQLKVTASAKSITLYGTAHKSFLVLQPKRQWIDIWFPLDREIDEFPVFKVQQRSKSSFMHYVRLQDAEDIEQVVLDWIAEAYTLTNT